MVHRAARHDLAQRRAAMHQALLATGRFAWASDPVANFFLLRVQDGKSEQLTAQLREQRILVRNCDNIPGISPGYVRAQVRGKGDNERLLAALGSGLEL